MAARSRTRRTISGKIAAIEKHNGPGDPRLGSLRQHGEALRAAEELADWARRSAAALEPLARHEVAAVGHLAAVIDARVAGGDHAA
jgi:hypothetical protein